MSPFRIGLCGAALATGLIAIVPTVSMAADGSARQAGVRDAATLKKMLKRRRPSGLIVAARDGRVERARALIAEGADVNERQNGRGLTPLMYAANQGYDHIVGLLLDAGADSSIAMADGTTALAYAAANGKIAAVELLLARTKPKPAALQRALANAAETGRPRTCHALIAAGAEIDKPDSRGRAPLVLAALNGRTQTVKLLLHLGAKVDRRDPKGRTALMYAGRAGHEYAVTALLNAGADPRLRDTSGATTFRGAVDRESIAALMGQHRKKIKPQPAMCKRLVGTAMVWPQGGRTRAASYGLFRKPDPASKAWIVTHQPSAPRHGTVKAIKRSEGSAPGWDAEFSPFDAPGPARQRSATAIWQTENAAPRRITAQPRDLPWGVVEETLNAAIDMTGDGKPDVLSVEFCCRNSTTSKGCDYHCGEHWSREDNGWVKCSFWRPE